MIDIESALFTEVAAALREKFEGIYVTGEYNPVPPKFPAVMFSEMDNTPYSRSKTQDSLENHAFVMYEADVFSNLSTGRKRQCRAIVEVIDEIMLDLGFDRTFFNPLPNQDTTIYRIKARYSAVVSADGVIYRN